MATSQFPSNPPSEFGPLLRQRRKALDLTQAALAARVGCSTVTIQKIEEGRRRPSRELAALLAHHLAVSPEERTAFMNLARGVAGTGGPVAATPPGAHAENNAGNLPSPLTPLVGRAGEVTTLRTVLGRPEIRLVTLVGPPGVGKTRVALAVTDDVENHYTDGIWFVPLDSLVSADLVLPALAQTLNIVESGQRSLVDEVLAFLRPKTLLLVLDGFEQWMDAGPQLTALLQGASRVKLLVTSREPLRVYGEQRFEIGPMAEPEAVTLFVQRVQALRLDFTPTAHEIDAIERICRRLDLMPLAIELAAGRLEQLSPQALLDQIENSDQRMGLTATHARDLPLRHQTLRAAIAWSFDRLQPSEQAILSRLGVFGGSFAHQAVSALLAEIDAAPGQKDSLGPAPVGLVLRKLLEKSLLRAEQASDGTRYLLLETVREFCLEQLAERGELDSVRSRHAQVYLDFVLSNTGLEGRARTRGHDQIERDMDNVRTALQWSVNWAPETAVRLTIALGELWHDRCHFTEGRTWFARVLAAYPAATALRSKALISAALLARRQSDLGTARQLAEEGLALARQLDRLPDVAQALTTYAWVVYDLHERPHAIDLLEECAVFYRRLSDSRNLSMTLTSLVHWMGVDPAYQDRATEYARACLELAEEQGESEATAYALKQLAAYEILWGCYDQAVGMGIRAVQLYRDLHMKPDLAWALEILGEAQWLFGDLAAAHRCCLEAFALFEAAGDRLGLTIIYHHLGQIARRQGNAKQAGHYYRESLAIGRQMHNVHMIARSLVGLAGVGQLESRPAQSAFLLAAARSQFDQLAPFLAPDDQAEIEQMIGATRAALDEAAFADAWNFGKTWPIETTIDMALSPGYLY